MRPMKHASVKWSVSGPWFLDESHKRTLPADDPNIVTEPWDSAMLSFTDAGIGIPMSYEARYVRYKIQSLTYESKETEVTDLTSEVIPLILDEMVERHVKGTVKLVADVERKEDNFHLHEEVTTLSGGSTQIKLDCNIHSAGEIRRLECGASLELLRRFIPYTTTQQLASLFHPSLLETKKDEQKRSGYIPSFVNVDEVPSTEYADPKPEHLLSRVFIPVGSPPLPMKGWDTQPGGAWNIAPVLLPRERNASQCVVPTYFPLAGAPYSSLEAGMTPVLTTYQQNVGAHKIERKTGVAAPLIGTDQLYLRGSALRANEPSAELYEFSLGGYLMTPNRGDVTPPLAEPGFSTKTVENMDKAGWYEHLMNPPETNPILMSAPPFGIPVIWNPKMRGFYLRGTGRSRGTYTADEMKNTVLIENMFEHGGTATSHLFKHVPEWVKDDLPKYPVIGHIIVAPELLEQELERIVQYAKGRAKRGKSTEHPMENREIISRAIYFVIAKLLYTGQWHKLLLSVTDGGNPSWFGLPYKERLLLLSGIPEDSLIVDRDTWDARTLLKSGYRTVYPQLMRVTSREDMWEGWEKASSRPKSCNPMPMITVGNRMWNDPSSVKESHEYPVMASLPAVGGPYASPSYYASAYDNGQQYRNPHTRIKRKDGVTYGESQPPGDKPTSFMFSLGRRAPLSSPVSGMGSTRMYNPFGSTELTIPHTLDISSMALTARDGFKTVFEKLMGEHEYWLPDTFKRETGLGYALSMEGGALSAIRELYSGGYPSGVDWLLGYFNCDKDGMGEYLFYNHYYHPVKIGWR